MNVTDIRVKADSWTPVDLASLPDRPPVQPELAGTNLIYPGLRHVFSGPPESAKTLAAYTILIQNARHNQTGILIDFEMGPYDARQRLVELGATPQELSLVLYIHPNDPATTERITTLAAYQPTIVVIDASVGAFELQGLDDNKRGEVQRLTTLFIGIFWEHRIATIMIDHVVKNAEQRGRFQIGSERKLGGTDVHIGFDTIKPISRGTNGHYKLIVHKDRGGYHKRGHLADFKLESDPDTHQMSWAFTDPEPTTAEGGYFRPTHLMEKVSIDLEVRSEPVPRNTVTDAIGGRKDYILKAITALTIEGFVTETNGPNRSKLLTSTRRYREADPICNPENPTSGSVVPVWFHSGSRNHSVCGGSVVPPLTGGTHRTPPTPDHPKPDGWFHENGHLQETPDLAWLDELTPDPEDNS